jgi:hypothetical protein
MAADFVRGSLRLIASAEFGEWLDSQAGSFQDMPRLGNPSEIARGVARWRDVRDS